MKHFLTKEAWKNHLTAKFQLLEGTYQITYDKLKNHYAKELSQIEKRNNYVTKVQIITDIITKMNEEKKN